MSSTGFNVFRRQGLADQVTPWLRQALRDGSLGDPLPGEVDLAQQLGISRPTLRTALARLAAEGLLEVGRGRRTRTSRAAGHGTAGLRRVVMISPGPRPAIERATNLVPQEIHAHLSSRGLPWEDVYDPKLVGARPERRLAELTAGRPGACWILLRAPAAVQRWFAQARLPALLIGSCQPGVALPSFDLDYRAVGWHAAGRVTALGHREIAIIQPARMLGGDLACAEGFRAYLTKHHPHARLAELPVGPDPAGARAPLTQLLRRRTPTALLVMVPAHTLATYLHLLELGRAIPRDLSLISRDSHPLFETALPGLTRYSTPIRRIATGAVRAVETLLRGQPLAPQPHLVTPRFIPGTTLGPAPAG